MDTIDTIFAWLKHPIAGKAVSAVFAVLLVVVVVRLTQRATVRYVQDKGSRYRVRKAITLLGYVAATLAIVSVFSDRLGQLTVVLGVAGAGVAFALQEIIASVAGWIAVSLGGYYAVGDRVQLGGIKGDVVDISVLRTTLAEMGQWVDGDLYNGRMVRVANSFVFKEPLVNYSGDFPFLWDEMVVPIRFGSDVDLAEKILMDAAIDICGDYEKEAAKIWTDLTRKYPLEAATTKPMVTFTFNENWISFTLRYAVRFDQRRTTKHLLSARILKAIDGTGSAVSVAAAAMEIFPMKTFEINKTEG